MSFLYNLVELTYQEKFKLPFFLSPFIMAAVSLGIVVLLLTITTIEPRTASMFIFISAIYCYIWIGIIFLRIRYFPANGELKKINYIPNKEISSRLAYESEKLGFEVKNEVKKLRTTAEVKANGELNGFPIEIARLRDHNPKKILYSYTTRIHIETKKEEQISITQKDLFLANAEQKNAAKKRILLERKKDLLWLMNQNQFISKIEFAKRAMDIEVLNEYGLILQLEKILNILIKIAQTYEK